MICNQINGPFNCYPTFEPRVLNMYMYFSFLFFYFYNHNYYHMAAKNKPFQQDTRINS